MSKKTLGFYLSILTAILALVCVYLYGAVSTKNSVVVPLLIVSAVLTAVVLGITAAMGRLPGGNLLPIVNSVLSAGAAGLAVMPMASGIVYVVMGMSNISTIQGYITFAVLEAVVCVLNIIAAFLGITQKTT